MNFRFFTHTVILLTLLGNVASCTLSIGFNEDGIVPYSDCPCEEGQFLTEVVSLIEEALFIKDPIQEQWNKMGRTYSTKKCWIVYESKTNTTTLIISAHNEVCCQIMDICNFPDFAKDWNISKNGQEVYFAGTVYQPIPPRGGLMFGIASYYDFILTYLKRK